LRYFLEVAYKGTRFSGFQAQPNALTIQGEIEKAFITFFGKRLAHWERGGAAVREGNGLTCSSRTDAGVHARQNYFHFDYPEPFLQKWIYNLNAILPGDIVIKSVTEMPDNAHCRFDALSRTYHYHIYQNKDPFIADSAYFYPYTMDIERLNEAASVIQRYTDFTSFSKRKTQVKTFNCTILQSEWFRNQDQWVYRVSGNRFLRGMVRALTATMLKVGRGILSVDDLHQIFQAKDCSKAFFDTPAHGLTLMQVNYDWNNNAL